LLHTFFSKVGHVRFAVWNVGLGNGITTLLFEKFYYYPTGILVCFWSGSGRHSLCVCLHAFNLLAKMWVVSLAAQRDKNLLAK
jgi:hypothetical protein